MSDSLQQPLRNTHTHVDSSPPFSDVEVLQYVDGRLADLCKSLIHPASSNYRRFPCLSEGQTGHRAIFNKLADLELGIHRLRNISDPDHEEHSQAIAESIQNLTSRCTQKLQQKDQEMNSRLKEQNAELNQQYFHVLKKLTLEYETKKTYFGHVNLDPNVVNYALVARQQKEKVKELQLKAQLLEADNQQLKADLQSNDLRSPDRLDGDVQEAQHSHAAYPLEPRGRQRTAEVVKRRKCKGGLSKDLVSEAPQQSSPVRTPSPELAEVVSVIRSSWSHRTGHPIRLHWISPIMETFTLI